MNRNRFAQFMLVLVIGVMALILGGASSTASSLVAPYAIVSFTIDGGGPLESGDKRFQLSATHGQADATEKSDSGRFGLTGGFWEQLILISPTATPATEPTPSSSATPEPGEPPAPTNEHYLPLIIHAG